MLETKIPAEIQDYKSKVIAGLSLRQLIGIGGAMVTALPVGILGYRHISNDILPWIIILLTVPWVGYGFLKFQGLNFEDYMRSWIAFNLFPQTRVYEDTHDNLLQDIHEELIEHKIYEQRKANGEIDEEDEE